MLCSLNYRNSPAANQLTVSKIATGLRRICRLHYQVSVLAFPFSPVPRSGFCMGKLESIRVVYGKSTICYQGHVRIGRTLYHGARLWNDLLWNDLLWNFLLWNFLLWNDLLWNDLLWNNSFRPFSGRHCYCVLILLYSSYLLTITPYSPLLPDNASRTLYQISIPGICLHNVVDTKGMQGDA